MSYNPLKHVDFNALPNYSVTSVPILTYGLIGITALTLGYVTMKDKEKEQDASVVSNVSSVVEAIKGEEIKEEKGGKSNNKKSKSNKTKNNRNKNNKNKK